MRIFFRILAILFAISVFGNLIVGKLFIIGIIITVIFAYLGWRPKTDETTKNKITPNLITEANPEVSEFSKSFSEQEKGAMLYLLMLMATSEGHADNKKFDFLYKQADILNFNLEGQSMEIYQQQNADYAYNILRNSNDHQKEWFSISLATIMTINGNPTQKEKSLSDRILSQINISDEQFKNANKKTQALFNKFNL